MMYWARQVLAYSKQILDRTLIVADCGEYCLVRDSESSYFTQQIALLSNRE